MAALRESLVASSLIVTFGLASTGCGAVAQLAFGWDSEETQRHVDSHQIQVQSVPPGATVVRRDDRGDELIGTTPLNDTVSYEREDVLVTDGWVPMLVTGIVELVAGAAIAVTIPTEDLEATSSDSDTLIAVGGLLIIAGLVDTIWGGVRSASGTTVASKKTVGNSNVTYIGSKDGLPSATFVAAVPDVALATLVLDPTQAAQNLVTSPPPPPPPPGSPPPSAPPMKAGSAKDWIVAVMDVEDANAKDRKRRVRKSLVKNLGDQLRIFVAQAGVRTIDRSSQDRALTDQLKRIKSDSYKQCYDDSCQIELGKALAASHILRSRITKFGKRCVLNGELIDLRAEVTVKAASAQGSCEAEGFLTMCDRVARDLVR